MVIKWGRHGRFIACTGYPECKNTMPIENQDGTGTAQGPDAQVTGEKCEKCESPMVLKSGKFGRFLACSKYPDCKSTKPLSTGIKCPEDNGEIVERRTKKGKIFYSCGNYPKCKFATWYKPVNKTCPGCRAHMLIERRTKKGDYIACLNKECQYKEEIPETAGEQAAT